MFVGCAITLLCLMSVSHSAPVCEKLVQPLDQLDRHHLEGSWVLVAGCVKDSDDLEYYNTRESAVIQFANASESSEISFKRMFGFNDSCKYIHSNISLEGSGFTFDDSNLTVTFLYTSCPDCLVTRFDLPGKLKRLYVFSRRRALEQSEMEEFKNQSECLNMLQPIVMDPTKQLCPEQDSKGEITEGQKA
ncbi:hypothetical protein JOB18_002513 [Solea senegalensis]|uniref:Apolipoprotein M n=1 Tax=Solea senegalensis TaxID=28829 RepID=A0AAV6Q540_SOLSE|nr:hypothetical protein JOB18_002513 [Solea senegalensis]